MKIASYLTAATVAAAVLFAPVVGNAGATGKQNFVLDNKTGYDISEVYVSPSRANDWQEDVLGDQVLGDGEHTMIKFHRAATPCLWDLKVVYQEDDSTAQWAKFDLCTISKITIYYNEKTEETSATYE